MVSQHPPLGILNMTIFIEMSCLTLKVQEYGKK